MDEYPKLVHSEVLATLIRLGKQRSGVSLTPGASDKQIRDMQAAAKRELGEPVPQSYVSLLRLSNGIQINGAYFKSAEHLVPENMDVPRPTVIVLGDGGSLCEYVYDRRVRRFHTTNMGFEDEVFEAFDTFEGMLIQILKEQQVYPRGGVSDVGE